MNLKKISNILLVLGILVFLPLLQAPTEVTTIPLQDKNIVVNIQTSAVEIRSNKVRAIAMNISYIDPGSQQVVLIVSTFLIEDYRFDLENNERGNYLFSFNSEQIADITISQIGLPSEYLYLFGFTVAFRILIFFRRKEQVIIE